ncbi:MAG: FecR domain-containing protein [Sphingobacteriales bacterium]|nr:FecR domain-containing protein [Sphingobacteriales bacterium]OJW34167.1 MAG: hypothetical protein BGO54_05755 [Sphingobacteriales bacterium 46-32]
MAYTPDQYKELFQRLINSSLSPGDTQQLLDWLGSNDHDPVAAELILKQLAVADGRPDEAAMQALEARLHNILTLDNGEQTAEVAVIPFYRKTGWRVAAAVAVLLTVAGLYLLINRKPATPAPLVQTNTPADIAPGREGAILELSDGRKLVLDSLGNGMVATQEGSAVVLNNGELQYRSASNASEIVYNTVSTPKGRQFRLQLADGTKVWLNAASSLRYPAVFAGNERLVEVTGEVYFEVAKQADESGKRKPFRVKINDQTQVEVLGTHFNINSYADEASINTTLLEGSVRIVNGQQNTLLQPGQQAQINGKSAGTKAIRVVNDVALDKVMAWKDGLFDFQDASLEEVMRQLERWYDLEIVYEKGIPKLEFVGKMGRDLSLANVLRGLEMSNVHFRIEEGRRLVVFP